MKIFSRLFALLTTAVAVSACDSQPATQAAADVDTSNAVKIVAVFDVKPEYIQKFVSMAGEMVKASQAEPGNISYTLNSCAEDPMTYTFIEIWRDLEAIEEHNASEHFTRLVPQLGAMCNGSDVKHYTEVKY
ncbi:MAG: antibiotic biosynthesis monooxygenase [Rikenellaceae bacterium]|nr:antibiotic biosynthesis monooxygenase [Rikenellaceae bacterium]